LSHILIAVSAFWLGILTSLSPCTVATNLAAFSYLVQTFPDSGNLFRASLLYSLGRMAVYIALGYGLTAGFLSIPNVSSVLMRDFNRFLGPVLVIIGVFVLDWVRLPIKTPSFFRAHIFFGRRAIHHFLMGSVFALAFCPVAAALFFGALVPLSIESRSPLLLPALYGVGTGLPVIGLVFSLRVGSLAFKNRLFVLSRVEGFLRSFTGGIFVLVGLYLILSVLFPIF
jgi:cytochrome c biogenesis protein CcdA